MYPENLLDLGIYMLGNSKWRQDYNSGDVRLQYSMIIIELVSDRLKYKFEFC